VENAVTKQTNPLEHRASAALIAEAIAASTLQSLVDDIITGIGEAEQLAIAERERALDPALSPHEARQAAEDADFAANRLRTILPRLQTRLIEQQRAEELQAWRERCVELESARDQLSAEVAETYPQLAMQMADLFTRAEALNSRIKDLNVASPAGEPHLYNVELHARGIDRFTRDAPSLLTAVCLFDWGQRPPNVATAAAANGRSVRRHCDTGL
jgi:hypothetical protein